MTESGLPDIPPHLYVDRPETLKRALPTLAKAKRLAIDTEADSLHHYFEKICLIQVSAPSGDNFIIDPLAGLDLNPFFGALGDKLLVIHGADYDLRLLRRTLGFAPNRIYDTAVAAQLLGYPAFGLSALIQRHFAIELPKASQRADWSRRPLTPRMTAYAVNDTCHLLKLTDILDAELHEMGRGPWRRQACQRLLEDASVDRQIDPDERWRVSGWRKLEGRQQALLHVLWHWREAEARHADRPPFKVLGNDALLQLAGWADANPAADPAGFPHLPRTFRGRRLASLQRAVKKGRGMPKGHWPPAPKPPARRPEPTINRTAERLRQARNAIAAALAVDPGVLAPNAALWAIAAAAPRSVDQLREAGRLLPWQAEAVGEGFLAVFRGEAGPDGSVGPEGSDG